MHRYRVLPLILAVSVIGGVLLTAASGSAHPRQGASTKTLKYFFKATGATFMDPSGKPLTGHARPKADDHFLTTVNAYRGTSAHHAKTWTATASLYCTIKKIVSRTKVRSRCEGVVAIGGSMLISVSTQNLGSTAGSDVYPITAGTGKYLHAKGTVKTTDVGHSGNSNAVITITG